MYMAARNVTGSARIRAAQRKGDRQKISAEMAETFTRLDDIRAVLISAIETLLAQNNRIDADVAAALKRRALNPVIERAQSLGKLLKRSSV
jgi:seryl-tRNA synthetase